MGHKYNVGCDERTELPSSQQPVNLVLIIIPIFDPNRTPET